MKAYCIDTSGLSNPLGTMPEDIHRSLWKAISEVVMAGKFAATSEIYEELTHIPGDIGKCLVKNKSLLQMEVDDTSWDGVGYLSYAAKLQVAYASVISENNQNRKGTVGLKDISIIALAGTLGLPVVSMETKLNADAKWKRIPCVCALEGIEHLTFNDFLRREGIVL